MNIVYFTHSLSSCWNHGNAHFLRGVLRELTGRHHAVTVYEPRASWSRENLLADHGEVGLEPFERAYPELSAQVYDSDFDAEAACDGADLVLVHEWNSAEVIAAIGAARAAGGRFTLLFHDTHHRLVSDPAAMAAFDLAAYDGVLAFGETLAQAYRRRGWEGRVWTWHEAADVALFRPPDTAVDRAGLVWIGNWGDGERTAELSEFLFRPARAAELALDVYGVRYPPEARATLDAHGGAYHGWLANARAPEVFARHLATVHVPRRFYVDRLPGIPTIRVFEALACGIPLVSAPWPDVEQLFRPGDFLTAADGDAMTTHLRDLRRDPDLRQAVVAAGLETIRARHTCGHRADELLDIVGGLHADVAASAAAAPSKAVA